MEPYGVHFSFRMSLSLVSRAIDGFSSSDTAVGIPFLLHTLSPNGVTGCDWLYPQLLLLFVGIKRLHLGSLDRSIGHIELRLSPCPAILNSRRDRKGYPA